MKIYKRKILIVLSIIIVILIFVFFIKKSEKNIINNVDSTLELSIKKNIFNDGDELGLLNFYPNTDYKTDFFNYPILRWKERIIVENNPKVNIEIKYPYFLGDKYVVNLNFYIENLIRNFIKEDKKELEKLVLDNPESFESSLFLFVDYRIIGVQNGVLSLELVRTDFTGGGNGNHDIPYVINWNLKTDKIFTNKELFCAENYLEQISKLSRAHIKEDISDWLNNIYANEPLAYKNIISLIEEGTKANKENFEYLIPYNNGLIVIFLPYQVFSGSRGIYRIYIPEDKITNVFCSFY